jgi:hypothetical protein
MVPNYNLMRVLVAVVTCESRRRFADAQRSAWVPHVKWGTVRFFLARQDRHPLPDEVFLDVPDDYAGLPEKVQAVSRWACNDWDNLLKLDDDVCLFPNRVLLPREHYAGWVHSNFCSGLGYWLDRDAMNVIAQAVLPPQPRPLLAEDRWTRATLAAAGIRATSLRKFDVYWVGRNRPLVLDQQRIRLASIAGEFTPEEMKQFY